MFFLVLELWTHGAVTLKGRSESSDNLFSKPDQNLNTTQGNLNCSWVLYDNDFTPPTPPTSGHDMVCHVEGVQLHDPSFKGAARIDAEFHIAVWLTMKPLVCLSAPSRSSSQE